MAEIERLRRQRMSGVAIARQLDMPRSTVGAILRRLGLGKLSALQPREPVIRYERERPGELLHLDIKSLGRIDGVGHRITGDRAGQSRKRGIGWDHLHVAIDDASRLAYTEVLPGLTGEDAAYARPYVSSDQRAAAIGPWTDAYNLVRPHAGIGDLSPWRKLNNLLGNDS